MTRARLGLAVFLSTGVVLAACATATLPPDSFSGGDAAPDVATTGDAAGCPQFDLQTDPKHCGSCTKACAAAEVCSLGVCKNACDPPTIKCNGSQSCSDLTKDPKNCGQCGTACSSPDAGPDTGTGNPDSGLPPSDGGFDAGTGWSFGSPGCDGGKCALACGAGTSLCQDSLCWDTQNAHDHCGGCSTACATDVEWCTKGHCCSTGQDYCSGACADLLSDPNNCGACGTKCGVSTPVCSAGVCSTAITYSQAIPSGVLSTGSTQCVAWHTFLSQLTGTYTSITLKGSNDLVGRTCTGAVANQLCQSLHSASVNPSAPTYVASVACNGHNWSTGNCAVTGKEISVDIDVAACQCPNPGYVARPCIGNENWGGVNTNTCSSPNPPAQTITVECK